jgi:hypothetical protein
MRRQDAVYVETPDAIVLGQWGKRDVHFAGADGQIIARLSDMLRELADLKRDAIQHKLDLFMPCKHTNAIVLDYL